MLICNEIESENEKSLVGLNKFNILFYESATPLAIFMGPELIVEMHNQKYQEIYPSRELLGKPLLEALPELAHTFFPGILKQVYETGESYFSREGRVNIYNPNTMQLEERYFDTTFSRLCYEKNQPFRILATPREVTDRVRTRKDLEASLMELKLEKELREKFISTLSHDLRTPLTVAKMSTKLLKRKRNDLKMTDILTDRIIANMDRADRMIRDLLDANRLKAGENLPIDLRPCRLDLIIADVVTDLESLYGAKFKVQNPNGEINGLLDATAIHRLIENLAINAAKYGGTDTPITISLKTKDDWCEITVQNFGNPISKEEQQKLFEPYHRAQSAIASKHKGWGIGLSLVKAIALAHDGSVSVKSDARNGTEFIIRLPLKLNLFTKINHWTEQEFFYE